MARFSIHSIITGCNPTILLSANQSAILIITDSRHILFLLFLADEVAFGEDLIPGKSKETQ